MLKLIDKMSFGYYKQKGYTVQQAINSNPAYIQWALANVKGFALDIEALVEYQEALLIYKEAGNYVISA